MRPGIVGVITTGLGLHDASSSCVVETTLAENTINESSWKARMLMVEGSSHASFSYYTFLYQQPETFSSLKSYLIFFAIFRLKIA